MGTLDPHPSAFSISSPLQWLGLPALSDEIVHYKFIDIFAFAFSRSVHETSIRHMRAAQFTVMDMFRKKDLTSSQPDVTSTKVAFTQTAYMTDLRRRRGQRYEHRVALQLRLHGPESYRHPRLYPLKSIPELVRVSLGR